MVDGVDDVDDEVAVDGRRRQTIHALGRNDLGDLGPVLSPAADFFIKARMKKRSRVTDCQRADRAEEAGRSFSGLSASTTRLCRGYRRTLPYRCVRRRNPLRVPLGEEHAAAENTTEKVVVREGCRPYLSEHTRATRVSEVHSGSRSLGK